MYKNADGTWRVGRMIAHSTLVLVVLVLAFGSSTIVDAQQRGIVLKLGKMGRELESGFHLKLPLVEDVVKMEVATVALKGVEQAYSKDAQTITVTVTANYNVNSISVSGVYREFRKDYEASLLLPQLKESIKSVISGYTAQGLIDNRPKLAGEIKTAFVSKIEDRGFMVSSMAVDNLDFDDQYEAAVRDKQVAEQKALAQVNVTKQEEEKKKQEIFKAEALAEKTRLEAEALRSSQGAQLVEKIKAEAALKAAEKWNGILPTQMVPGGALPFINLTH